jgi:putative endonuclease
MYAWYVYIVRCADRTLYTGIATNVAARVAAHNRRQGAKYTRGRAPVELVYQEPAADRAAAQRREHEIKRLAAAAKHALIAASPLLPIDRREPTDQ